MPILANARHERYAQELAKGKTADEAYQLAGFKANRGNASTLKTKQSIQDRVAELQAAVVERLVIDEAYVLGSIHDTVERCKQAKPVLDRKGDPVFVETPEGDVTPAFVFDAKSVLRGAELLGKHIGMFKERVEHTGKDGKDLLAERSNIELARLIAFQLTKASQD